MRFNYQCPKCQSRNVLEVIGSKLNTQTKIPLTKWSMKNATLDRYICTDCGYTEEYVQLDSGFKRWANKMLDAQGGRDDGYV